MDNQQYRDLTQAWYHTARWGARRSYQLRVHPLCAMCLRDGVVERASVVDHVVPHNGEINRFWLGELQSLCVDHHNRSKQQVEHRGYANDIGNDGFPSDPNHPFNIASRR
jgi:5-methylcytosine-specific restriction enzyme A